MSCVNQRLFLAGIFIVVVGMGLAVWGTMKREWYVGEATDLRDAATWEIRDQMLGLAMPFTC